MSDKPEFTDGLDAIHALVLGLTVEPTDPDAFAIAFRGGKATPWICAAVAFAQECGYPDKPMTTRRELLERFFVNVGREWRREPIAFAAGCAIALGLPLPGVAECYIDEAHELGLMINEEMV